MALLQSVQLEHLPTSYVLHVALFHSVGNSAFLHRQLLDGNAEFEYAFIDAGIVRAANSFVPFIVITPVSVDADTETQKLVSRLHTLAAAFRAVNDSIEGRLRSRNVHSEIVFALSPNNNISESFRRFGIAPTTKSLLVIKVSTPDKPVTASVVQHHLNTVVKGTQVAFEDAVLNEMTDWPSVRKYYKLSAGGRAKGGALVHGSEPEMGKEERKELEVQILGAMALRGAS